MGDTLGHYALLERIGVGGLGDVYRARDTKFGRTTAIKVIRPELAADSRFRRQFLRQTSALRSLSHPNIATLFEVGEDQGRLFLAIEWVVGEPVRAAVAGRALNVRRAVDFAVELADALADGHAQMLVHGDITSDTVVLTPTEHAKLLDFGLSAWTRGGEIRRQLMARRAPPTEQALCAARYLSPEQAVGKRFRPSSRHLLARRRAVRNAHRPSTLRRHLMGRRRAASRCGNTNTAQSAERARVARARRDRGARTGKARGRPIPECRIAYRRATERRRDSRRPQR